MLSRHRFCCYMCLPNALLLRECRLHILPTILLTTSEYIDYFLWKYCICLHSVVEIFVDFEPMYPGFESRESMNFIIIIFFYVFFLCFFFCHYYYSTNLQMSLLRFSYFITPYDAQASSAFSALITKYAGPCIFAYS